MNRPDRWERGAAARGSGGGRSTPRARVGQGLSVAGVLPLALTGPGEIDEYEPVVHPRLAGHGPTLFARLSGADRVDARRSAGGALGRDGDAVRTGTVAIPSPNGCIRANRQATRGR